MREDQFDDVVGCDREKIRQYIQPINAEYDSPIRLFYQTVDNMQQQIKGSCDQAVYQAVCRLGINIDKDKLEQAIHQDRERYDEAYRRGYNKAKEDIVRCKDCKHRPKEPNLETYENGFDIEFPEDSKCPCQCSSDRYYSWYPDDDWFCAEGERRTD